MTDAELIDYVGRALNVARERKNQIIINLLEETKNWIDGSTVRPDLTPLQQLGTNGYPKALQLYTWLMERK